MYIMAHANCGKIINFSKLYKLSINDLHVLTLMKIINLGVKRQIMKCRLQNVKSESVILTRTENTNVAMTYIKPLKSG